MADSLGPVHPLSPGDTVAVVAPAGPVPEPALKAGLERLGQVYRLRVADDICRVQGFLAGDDGRRAEELNRAFRDPDVRGVWVARGGYGCSRILGELDGGALRADPIPVVGFSDATALLTWVGHQGLRSLHGPVITQLSHLPQAQVGQILDLLQGRRWDGFGAFRATSLAGRRGVLVGGNLSVLAHLCGGPFALACAGTICLLEDVGERPYALDRYLSQLLAQVDPDKSLARAAGVVMGDFERCEETKLAHSPTAVEAIGQRLALAGVPRATGAPVGHGRRNCAFPVGLEIEVDGHGALTAQGTLCQ